MRPRAVKARLCPLIVNTRRARTIGGAVRPAASDRRAGATPLRWVSLRKGELYRVIMRGASVLRRRRRLKHAPV